MKALHKTRQIFVLRILAAAVIIIGAAVLGESALRIPVLPLVGFIVLAITAVGMLFLGEATRERASARHARQESEERYPALVEHSIQGILLIRDGQIVDANPACCAMTGFSAAEIVSMTPVQLPALIHPDDRAAATERQRQFKHGDPIDETNEPGVRNKCHGGRVWAEAAVDQGSTFFFTLNGNSES